VDFLRRLTRDLVRGLKAFAGLVLPVFRKHRGPGDLPPGLRIGLHVAAVLTVAAVLCWLNSFQDDFPRWVPEAWWIRRFYLPLSFLLIYWLCWGAFLLGQPPEEGVRFPDIDQAWEEARAALAQARVELKDVPLFLVLGEPEAGEPALFHAAQLPLVVRQAPARDDAPLHVYATRDAIYLTCGGASVLGRYGRLLAGRLATPDGDPVEGDCEGPPLHVFRRQQPSGTPLLTNQEIDEQAARLEYLCRLVVRDRHPHCAVNGVLLLIPFAACDSDQQAVSTADALHRDLATATALQVDCPHFALLCDMESAPGFLEFAGWFGTTEKRNHRLGAGCPLFPDFRADGPPRGQKAV
jgi:hypothetical protein